MPAIDDLINPAELVLFARGVQAKLAELGKFPLAQYLPSKSVNTTLWSATSSGGGVQEAATARAQDTQAINIGGGVITRSSGTLPPIGAQQFISEQELTQLLSLGAQGQSSIVAALFDLIPSVVQAIEARAELARGQALAFGVARFAENGVNAVADFGATPVSAPDQFPTAAVAWSDPAATPLADLLAWAEAYRIRSGVGVGSILCSPSVASALSRSPEVIGATIGIGATTPTMVAPGDLNNLLAAKWGLPPLTIVSKTVRFRGVAVQVLPADRVVFVPEGDTAGATVFGITAHGADLASRNLLGFEDRGGIVVINLATADPPQRTVVGAANVMPVIAAPEAVFSAQVL